MREQLTYNNMLLLTDFCDRYKLEERSKLATIMNSGYIDPDNTAAPLYVIPSMRFRTQH